MICLVLKCHATFSLFYEGALPISYWMVWFVNLFRYWKVKNISEGFSGIDHV